MPINPNASGSGKGYFWRGLAEGYAPFQKYMMEKDLKASEDKSFDMAKLGFEGDVAAKDRASREVIGHQSNQLGAYASAAGHLGNSITQDEALIADLIAKSYGRMTPALAAQIKGIRDRQSRNQSALPSVYKHLGVSYPETAPASKPRGPVSNPVIDAIRRAAAQNAAGGIR